MNKIVYRLVIITIFMALACSSGQSSYGKLKNFKGVQLYYTNAVTEKQADALGEYIISSGFADGSPKTVQLAKTGKTFEFRMVIKKGIEKDDEFITIFKQLASELSNDVFDGDQVDVHLCNDQLETIRVVVASESGSASNKGNGSEYSSEEPPPPSNSNSSYGKENDYNGVQLFHTNTVTDDEAEELGRYLVESEFADGQPKTVQINRSGNTYEFRMVVKKGIEQDQEFVNVAKMMAAELSEKVFNGNQVDIHFCDENLETLRVIVNLNN